MDFYILPFNEMVKIEKMQFENSVLIINEHILLILRRKNY